MLTSIHAWHETQKMIFLFHFSFFVILQLSTLRTIPDCGFVDGCPNARENFDTGVIFHMANKV
jgi:hypothetical protein